MFAGKVLAMLSCLNPVSLHTAAHYLFETEFSAKMFLYNVSTALEEGGVFYGVVPCGKRILALLNNKVESESFSWRVSKYEKSHPSSTLRNRTLRSYWP